MSAYEALAGFYEAVNEDADYPGLTDYLARHLARSKVPVEIVLDLACGTGAVSRELARRGYDVIGVDQSAEMLAVAQEQSQGEKNAPLYLCQPMEELDLYGTIDAAVCCMDSVNYVLDKRALLAAFKRLSLFLVPGGRLVLDAVTPRRLRRMDGQCFTAEVPGGFVSWQAAFDGRSKLAEFRIDVFSRGEDGRYDRATEEHLQRAYTPQELQELLLRAGFGWVRQYGERKMRPPAENEERIFFVAENNWKEKQKYE